MVGRKAPDEGLRATLALDVSVSSASHVAVPRLEPRSRRPRRSGRPSL